MGKLLYLHFVVLVSIGVYLAYLINREVNPDHKIVNGLYTWLLVIAMVTPLVVYHYSWLRYQTSLKNQ